MASRLYGLMSMRLFPLLALCGLTLSSCEAPADSSGEAATPSASASEAGDAADGGEKETAVLVFAESGWLTVGADGGVQTTFLDADGRYRDLRNGEQVAQGSWQQRPDGSLCFEPDTGFGACWTIEPLEDDGSAIAVNGEGKRIEVRRVSYIGPDASNDGDTDG